MMYTVKYIEPHGDKEIEANLDVPDTNMDDLPLLLSKFAEVICGQDVKVTSIVANEEDFEEGLENLQNMVNSKLDL